MLCEAQPTMSTFGCQRGGRSGNSCPFPYNKPIVATAPAAAAAQGGSQQQPNKQTATTMLMAAGREAHGDAGADVRAEARTTMEALGNHQPWRCRGR